MIDSRESLARYQALFRDVNNCVRDVADPDIAIFMCECGHQDCLSTVELSLEEYERIRSNPTWFVLAPDHVTPHVGRVISQDPCFVVVEPHAVLDHEQEAGSRSRAGFPSSPRRKGTHV